MDTARQRKTDTVTLTSATGHTRTVETDQIRKTDARRRVSAARAGRVEPTCTGSTAGAKRNGVEGVVGTAAPALAGDWA
jgi:hypothetical protein